VCGVDVTTIMEGYNFMNLTEWAIKHQVPYAAVEDLRRSFGMVTDPAATVAGESEVAVQNRVRLEASRNGCRLWRNNVGATYTDDGSFLRYGLVNDSQQMNAKIKSSDLVGIKPLLIKPEHVGSIIGVFLAREIKEGGWVYTGTDREAAQLKFLKLVASLGGDAAFATGEGTI